ncbi:hypothetical protein LDENG_00123460 [Lucifuga dentata]|nr:hypothetical protein LDENG_00123460 [Lucifuga dentata]
MAKLPLTSVNFYSLKSPIGLSGPLMRAYYNNNFKSRLKTEGDRAFAVMAPKLWNSLPSNLRFLDSVDSFKKQLKSHLFRLAFG